MSSCSWTCELWFWLAAAVASLQMLGLRRLSLISDVRDLTSATPPPSRPDEILTTLQIAPRQRGWRLTVVAFPSLLTWYLQKTLNCMLTRLSCRCFADTVYFHLPPLSGDMKCVYGVSCYRQIEAKVSQRCFFFFFFFFWFVSFFNSLLIKTFLLLVTPQKKITVCFLLRVFLIWLDLNVNFLFCLCPSWRQARGRRLSDESRGGLALIPHI